MILKNKEKIKIKIKKLRKDYEIKSEKDYTWMHIP